MNKIFIFISLDSESPCFSETHAKKNLEHKKEITNLTIKIYLKFFSYRKIPGNNHGKIFAIIDSRLVPRYIKSPHKSIGRKANNPERK